ncbi:hypothetical protein ACFSSA_10045 [Luteolibacter algae]|uniref:Uncharacterized protein n=1 Tax=Luteolibacter algae TaxID=454151 RepID=A0ABW5D9A1_9BACT
MKTNYLIPGVALAIGLGIGFGVGKKGGASSAESVVDGLEMRTRSSMDRASSERSSSSGRDSKVRSVEEIYRKPGQSNRVQALLDYYANLSPDEFSLEAEKLDNMPFNERILASVLLFGKWAEVDPTAAMAFTDTMGMAGAFARPTVLQGWASTDPVNAAKYYTDNPGQFAMMNMMGGGRGGQDPGSIIASEWAKQDPKAAMEWAAALGTKSGEAMTSVVSEVAKTDPKKAAEMAGAMDEKSRGDAYEAIAKQWGTQNFSEALAWANSLPEDQRGLALASAIEGLAQSSPELAAQEIGKLSDKDAQRNAIPTVAKNYARQDVQGSMDWLKSIDNEQAVRDTMREVMPIWTASDSTAALAFVKSQSSPDLKDSAAQSYIFSNSTANPADLIEVASLITDERDQSRATSVVAARWMQTDKAAATDFINSNSSISPEMKQRLISGQSMWGGDRGRGRGR